MIISNAKANIGLHASATRTRAGVSGTAVVGAPEEKLLINGLDVAYQSLAVFAAAADELIYNLATGTLTPDAWSPGTQQVDTATAVGSIVTAGSAIITVTAVGLVGSPLAVPVAVVASESATSWAAKVRTALAANAAVSAVLAISGAGINIVTSRKPAASYLIGNQTVNVYRANDATINIEIANGTCSGITAAPTSTPTTAGVASAGVLTFNSDVDFEGIPVPTVLTIRGLEFENSGSELSYQATAEAGVMGPIAKRLFYEPGSADLLGLCTFTATGPTLLKVTLMGSTT